MPTISEYARARGFSHQYISKLVKKKGMPLDSYEAADLWRQANTSSKPPTDPKHLKVLAAETDDYSPEARERRKAYFAEKPNGTKIPSEDLQSALFNTIRASDEAFRLLEEAMIEGKISKIQPLLSIHSRAIEARIDTETKIREEMERRNILIPLDTARDMARKGFDIILSRLSSLPQNIAPRCNPDDPHHAMEILQTECVAIIQDAQKAYES